MPKRIQRKRAKGFKMPPNCVYVGRPTKWGNPYSVEEYGREGAVRNYRGDMFGALVIGVDFSELRGKDLVCWCHLCEQHKDGLPLGIKCLDCAPCHADILLTISNDCETSGDR